MGFFSTKEKEEIKLSVFCRRFYEENILSGVFQGVDIGTFKGFIEEVFPEFSAVDTSKLKEELTILRFELFSLVWRESFTDEASIAQAIFTLNFLVSKGREEIWDGMGDYNTPLSDGIRKSICSSTSNIENLMHDRVRAFEKYLDIAKRANVDTEDAKNKNAIARVANLIKSEKGWKKGEGEMSYYLALMLLRRLGYTDADLERITDNQRISAHLMTLIKNLYNEADESLNDVVIIVDYVEFEKSTEIETGDALNMHDMYPLVGDKTAAFTWLIEMGQFSMALEKDRNIFINKAQVSPQVNSIMSVAGNEERPYSYEEINRLVNSPIYRSAAKVWKQSGFKQIEDLNIEIPVDSKRTGNFYEYSKTMKPEEAADVYRMWLLHVRYYHPKLDVLFSDVSIPTFFLPVPMELLQEVPEILKEYKREDGTIEDAESMGKNISKYARRYYPRTGTDEEIIRRLGDNINDQNSLGSMMSKIKKEKDDWYFEYKEI